jgi:hypothetical protein
MKYEKGAYRRNTEDLTKMMEVRMSQWHFAQGVRIGEVNHVNFIV